MKKQNTGTHTIYVSNLRFDLDEGNILGLFKHFGYIKNINMLKEGKQDKFKGVAFVDMVNLDDAKTAIEKLNGSEKFGRTLKVSFADRQNFKEEKTPGPKMAKSENQKSKAKKKSTKTIKKERRQNPKEGLKALFNNTK